MDKKKAKKPKLLKPKKQELRTQKQNIGGSELTAREHRLLQMMAHASKSLRNVALYTHKQIYKEHKRAATDEEMDEAMKADVNYKMLQSNSVQAIRNDVKKEINSYFNAIEEYAKDPGKFSVKPRFPGYLDKEDKRIIEIYQVTKIKNGYWKVPMSRWFEKKYGKIKIRLPKNLLGMQVRYIELKPIQRGRFFEAHYTYKAPKTNYSPNGKDNKLGIDLGVNCLASCVCSNGETFIIDGRRIKSINQYFNKVIAQQQQTNIKNGISKRVMTNKLKDLWRKRELKIDGYLGWAAGEIIRRCEELGVGEIAIGKSVGWKHESNLGKVNNQNFVQIPFNKLIAKIENLAKKHGIFTVIGEESYTSKASFYDRDDIPVFDKALQGTYTFSGVRKPRGRYKSKDGRQLHGDINGALNILRKSGLYEFPDDFVPKNPFIVKRKGKATAA